MRTATKVNVLIRWAPIHRGRVGVQFSAVFPVRTNPAPISPSNMINIKEATANLLTFDPFPNTRNAEITKMITRIPAIKEVTRCENSMTVLKAGADGIISP